MQIDKNLWFRTITLEREFSRRGESISRGKLQDALQIPQAQAQDLIFALENKDVIRATPDTFEADGERALILADVHIPFQDKLCVDAIMEYGLEYKPTTIIIDGDLIDFYQISRFVKNPQKKSTSTEIEETKKFLTEMRHNFPDAKILYKSGNHEDRLEHYICQSATQIYDLVSDLLPVKLNLAGLNIQYLTEPFAVGKLWVLHGHEKPGGSYNPEYVCNVMWKYIHDHFIVGHFHRKQQKTFKNISGHTFWTGSLGYCAGAMDYAILNQWTQGFCTVDFSRDGNFRAYNHEISDGEIF